MNKGRSLPLRLIYKGANLHAIELHLIEFKGVGVASLHAFLIHLQQFLAIGQTLLQHGERLIEADDIDAEQLRLKQDVATLLGQELLSHRLLHLRLLVAGSIFRGELHLLTNHKFAFGNA